MAEVIRRREESFNHPLEWLVCLLHANELPLQHLFETLNGATTGPRQFSESIGKRLASCIQQPDTSFKSVRLTEDLSNVDLKELSRDQQYLLEISSSINAGECSIDLSIRNLGCLNHSRWLTTANRMLRLYDSDKNSFKLQALIMFIIRVCVPMWFAIKSYSYCKDGARHSHQIVARSRYLSQEHEQIIDPVLHRNSYFAHPENIILAMITDHRPHIREQGLRRVMKARAATPNGKIRNFKVSANLGLDAVEYFKLINWTDLPITKPPNVLKQ